MHDMNYYEWDIVSLVTKTLECVPTIDRGNIRIWIDSTGTRAVFLSLNENNYRGALEIHENGKIKDQINYNGVLEFNQDRSDLVINKEKIVNFLNKWKY